MMLTMILKSCEQLSDKLQLSKEEMLIKKVITSKPQWLKIIFSEFNFVLAKASHAALISICRQFRETKTTTGYRLQNKLQQFRGVLKRILKW